MMISNKSFKKIFFCILIFFLAKDFFSEEKSTWTIAAHQFSFIGKNTERSDLLSVLPKLILEELSENATHNSFAEEIFSETSYAMKQKRLELFLQLSKEVQARDSVALFHYREKEMKARIRDAEKKIAVLKKQIDESIEDEKKEFAFLNESEKNQVRERKTEKQKFIDLFKSLKTKREINFVRPVAIYKNDASILFQNANANESENKTPDFFSNEFVKQTFSENVNALITGKILLYSDYLSLTIELISYPSAKIIFTHTDVSSLSEISFLAKTVARSLAPAISNSLPSELYFVVEPKEALENFSLSIDDTRYYKIPETIFLEAGVHTILFASDGYKKASTNYAFSGNQKFTIHVNLEKQEEQKLYMQFEKPVFGDLFVDGKKIATLTDENQLATISINDEPILGEFVSTDGSFAPFFIASEKLKNKTAASLSLETFDRNAYIDKRRKLMYTSYSVLITSALASFFTHGTFSSKLGAYSRGTVSYQDVRSWQIASWATIGITAGCGVWFVVELIRYFVAADKVLPSNAKKLSKKNEASLQSEIENLQNKNENTKSENVNADEILLDENLNDEN